MHLLLSVQPNVGSSRASPLSVPNLRDPTRPASRGHCSVIIYPGQALPLSHHALPPHVCLGPFILKAKTWLPSRSQEQMPRPRFGPRASPTSSLGLMARTPVGCLDPLP